MGRNETVAPGSERIAVNTKVLRDIDIREPLFDFLEEKLGKIRILEEQ